jgi:hypothetical protein
VAAESASLHNFSLFRKIKLMKTSAILVTLVLLIASRTTVAETPTGLPAYPNYSIMLVANNGDGVLLMHNPKGEIEFIPVQSTKAMLDAGYVQVRVAELTAIIQSLQEANARLTTENARLQNVQTAPVPASLPPSLMPTQADLDARREAQNRADKAERRQQALQTFFLVQSMNRPQPSQPYQLPMPVIMPAFVPAPAPQSFTCESNRYGNQTTTNCR